MSTTSTPFEFDHVGRFPVQPQPSIYEGVVVKVGRKTVDHKVIEQIQARPSWDFAEADARLREKTAAKKTAQKTVDTQRQNAARGGRPAKKTTAKKAATKGEIK